MLLSSLMMSRHECEKRSVDQMTCLCLWGTHLKAGKALLMINGLELGEKQDEGTTTARVQCKRKRKLRR